MPKIKTRKVIAKRIKITKTGKIKHRRVTISHLRRKESVNRKLRKTRLQDLSAANKKKIKIGLPYSK